jgi:hypothetical protein
MFAMRRRTRYGCVSAFHNMLWCVVGPHSTDAVERIATQKYACEPRRLSGPFHKYL